MRKWNRLDHRPLWQAGGSCSWIEHVGLLTRDFHLKDANFVGESTSKMNNFVVRLEQCAAVRSDPCGTEERIIIVLGRHSIKFLKNYSNFCKGRKKLIHLNTWLAVFQDTHTLPLGHQRLLPTPHKRIILIRLINYRTEKALRSHFRAIVTLTAALSIDILFRNDSSQEFGLRLRFIRNRHLRNQFVI